MLWNRIRIGRLMDTSSFGRNGSTVTSVTLSVARNCSSLKWMGDSTTSLRQMRSEIGFLAADGYRVLRFWNNDVLGNLDGVLVTIQDALRG
ncbi:DUF559 domain-containing protein [Bradyrhizobium sp.]|uniref:DUF559 domain-containing protein n=1 Tax=Bradyrhizobium sp. TaxID=376 RepID=UPI0034368D64